MNVKCHLIPEYLTRERFVISSEGDYPPLQSNYDPGISMHCPRCNHPLITGFPPEAAFYCVVIKCPDCRKYAEVTRLPDTFAEDHIKGKYKYIATAATGTLRASPEILHPTPYCLLDGSRDKELVKTLTNEKTYLSKFVSYFSLKRGTYTQSTFYLRVATVLHDFAFFARQHPQALVNLNEELIRDLFLVALKTAFPASEGEVFNYSG